MDFRIPAELTALRQSFASFLDREVRPIEERLQPELWSYSPDRELVHAASREVVARSVEAGFYAAYMPEEVGGMDLSTLGTTLLVEDAAASGMRFAMAAIAPPSPSGPTPLLLGMPRHLWPRYVEPIVRGEATMCFALTEPEAGSDAQSIRTRATRQDDGSWVLDGHKHYITNGDRADVAIVFAVTDAEKRAAGGITAFVVPGDVLTRGKVQWTMADTHPAEILLDGAHVPADHVIGEVGLGFAAAMSFLNSGRAFIGAQSLGLAEYALGAAVEHARSRTAFGRPIGRNQGVSFPLAESRADLEAVRWLVYHLAWAVDEGEDPMLDASITKMYATEKCYAVADRAVQTFGGMGLLREGPVERVLRHLRMLRVVEGATGIQQLVIGRSMGL
jgi:alkylation response protein AidB-like acyl-CoA dehydrogenase